MREKSRSNYTILFVISLMIITQACSPTRDMTDDRRSQIADRPPAEQIQTDQPEYQIRPGDEIEILVWEQESFNTLTTVSRTGTIAVPLLGEISVVGLTQEELTRELERRLAEYVRGEVNLTVSIRNLDDMIVSVIGMVASPDNYPVIDQTSIFRIIATAGGQTELANMKRVKVYRPTGPDDFVTLDLIEYLDSGRMNSPELMVRPGDIVYVPREENVVREMSVFLRDVVVLFGIFRVFR